MHELRNRSNAHPPIGPPIHQGLIRLMIEAIQLSHRPLSENPGNKNRVFESRVCLCDGSEVRVGNLLVAEVTQGVDFALRDVGIPF